MQTFLGQNQIINTYGFVKFIHVATKVRKQGKTNTIYYYWGRIY